jgi:putative restriction endonuclease
MFGGGANYVKTLDELLSYVATHERTTDKLVGWHRGTFS